MRDFKIGSLPGESHDSDFDEEVGSTKSVTFPRVGDEVLGKRRILVNCNQRTSVPKIDHPLQPEQPATNSSSTVQSEAALPPSRPRFPFDTNMTFQEFEGMELVKDLPENDKHDYYDLCRYGRCLPHGFSNHSDHLIIMGIKGMLNLARGIKAANVKEDVPVYFGNLIKKLDYLGFTVDFLASVAHKIAEEHAFFKQIEIRRSQLEAEISRIQEELCIIDVEQIPKFEIEFKDTLWGGSPCSSTCDGS